MHVCLICYIPVCAIYTACALYMLTCLNVCIVHVCVCTHIPYMSKDSLCVYLCVYLCCMCMCLCASGWVWIYVGVRVHVHMCAWVSVSGNSSNVILVTSIAAPNWGGGWVTSKSSRRIWKTRYALIVAISWHLFWQFWLFFYCIFMHNRERRGRAECHQ